MSESMPPSLVRDLERSLGSGLAPSAPPEDEDVKVLDVLSEAAVLRSGSGDGEITRGVPGIRESVELAILDAPEDVEECVERPRGGCGEKAERAES